MSINANRRRERHLRWGLFLAIASVWLLFTPVDLVYLLIGVFVLACGLLNSWGPKRIPVLAYHSTSADGEWLGKPDLTVPIRSFQAQMRWLAKHHYRSLSMDELLDARKHGNIPPNPIAITFDDGYLDNWVGAEPILDHYNLQGTIFVSSDWIEPGNVLRPRWGKVADDNLQWNGYLNKIELRQLANGKVMDIQSHAASHDTLFQSDNISRFASPDFQPQWLRALISPRKPDWYRPNFVAPTGYPVFATTESLAGTAFYPNHSLIDELIELASTQDFLSMPGWQKQLSDRVNEFRESNNSLGEHETAEQTSDRWHHELAGSKQQLEAITAKPVNHLCWPRDSWCRETHDLAFAYGYRSVTGDSGFNTKESSELVSRIYIESCGIQWLDVMTFVLQIWVFKGRFWAWPAQLLCTRLVRRAWNRP